VNTWRLKIIDHPVVTTALYAIVTIGAAVAGYFSLFTQFALYDDEGTLLVMLKAFVDRHPLYSDICTPYGPFYYELFGSVFGLAGIDVTTNASRLMTLVLWIGTSFLFGLAAERLTGMALLAAAGMIAAFASLDGVTHEPMHPQSLYALLMAAFVLLVVGGPRRRGHTSGAAVGAVFGAVLLTKVNLGVFAGAAVALAAVLTIEPLYARRWLRWPVIAAFLVLPIAVVGRDLDVDWVRTFVGMQFLAGLAVVLAARVNRPQAGDDAGPCTSWLAAFAVGLVVAITAILVAIVARGSSPAAIYDGMIVEALRVRDALMVPYAIPRLALGWGAVGVAAAVLMTRASRGESALHAGLFRTLAGLVLWCTPAGLMPATWIAWPLCWVAAIPPANVSERPFRRFTRVLLSALAVIEFLQVYPVPGSQVGIAALTLIPAGALCFGDAVVSFRAWSSSRVDQSSGWTERLLILAASLLVLQFGITSIVLPGAAGIGAYRGRLAMPFPGADRLHLPQPEVEAYAGLVELLHHYGCTSFIGYPNVNSVYLWSGIDAPAPFAPGGWITGLDDARQQRVVDELRVAQHPCAFSSKSRADFWEYNSGQPEHDGPLVRYIFKNFHVVDRAGDFWFMLPKDAPGQAGDEPGGLEWNSE
jgi:hypothetical protein